VSALLEVRGLRAGYEGIPVVFGLDLTVEAGEIVAVLGSNGAGKTTTLRAISGMVSPMSGVVVFDGSAVSNDAPEKIARRGLVHVPEGRGLFRNLTVGETLRLAGALAGVSRGAVNERLAMVHEAFPVLAGRSGQAAGTLSGGEQQMLALARGLLVRPKLLMVDEMSQGLAPSVVDDLFEIVARFPAMGTSVLVVEQFVDRALALSSRAYVLDKGKVAYDGDSATLAADEKFVKGSYLGEVDDDAPVGVGAMSHAGGRDAHRETRLDSQRDGLGKALTEDVRVSLPPVMLRSLQQRADTEGVALEELLRDMVESAGGSEGPRSGVKTPARRSSPPRPVRPAGTSASRRAHDD
jgi:branched-chain amino acid transport system ATP-binding protein